MARRVMGMVLAAALATASIPIPATAAPVPKVGEIAPDFEVETLDHAKIRLSELRGQVVVLNFWATWCGPCKAELPTLDAYFKERRSAGLRVFAVTTQDSLPLYQLRPLAALMTIPMVRHMKGPYAVLGGVPTNYVIDRAGVLRYAKADAFDLDALNALLVPLLNEGQPPPASAKIAAR